MVFSSLLFLFLFLPVNLILYYSTNNKNLRNIILVVLSLIFYAWGEPVWVSLLLLSSFVDYLNGLFIEKHFGTRLAKIGIVSTLIFNLGILFTFKYADFFIDNVNVLLHTHFSKPGFMLPIGISFYTFQTISYTIDVYRGEVKAQRSYLNFLMFVSLYHQLVAGPIVRYSHIANEIESRQFSWSDFSSGITRFCKGLFKKVAIANIAGELSGPFLNGNLTDLSMSGAWYGIILYTLQIYFDFSGYSDMAIGLGRMFGFHYHENFKHPYISKSITDFWRRWHISLSTCFRDYLYIPMGGNRKHPYRNIIVVWAFTGLWHGASWNFVIWGLYFGLLLILEKLLLGKWISKLYAPFQHLYALFFIVIGWAIFYFTDIHRLTAFLKILFVPKAAVINGDFAKSVFFENISWMLLAFLCCLPVYEWMQNKLTNTINKPNAISLINVGLNLCLFIVSVALLVGNSYNPFIYFRF